MNPYPSRRRDRAAFTLMEVLLVLVILVVLGSLAVGVFRGTRQKADRNAAKAQIGLLESQLGIYELDIGQMPPSLNALLVAPNDAYSAEKWGGPYIDKDPIDPWGSPYQYQ